MKPLIKKELISIFCSGIGLVFALLFLVACGCMLWIVEGSFNILDAGYATLDKFFGLAPMLLIVLTPALTMRLIAEEKKNKTFNVLMSRPLSVTSVWFSKWFSTFLFILLVFLSTLVYTYTLCLLGNPKGNVDTQVIIVSYIALILVAGVFISIGILASSLTSNQIVAFVVALFLNFSIFYGFEMLSSLFSDGSTQISLNSMGLLHHYQHIIRGIIDMQNALIFVVYFILAWALSIFILSPSKKQISKEIIVALGGLFLVVILTFSIGNEHFDLTKDRRYTLAEYSEKLMADVANDKDSKIQINIYLSGDLNAGFQRLNNSMTDLLVDLNKYADNKIKVSRINPQDMGVSQQELPRYMAERNMPAIMLNEVDRNGKLSQQMIYPYAEVIAKGDTLQVSLLKKTQGNTAEENLNASAEDLEFQFVDAIRLLLNNQEQNIAFIEGHGELPRAYVYDAEEALAKYYYVNRGEIGNNVSVLDEFKVVIIAGATQKFTETEKFILDQYLMKGGNVLWLLDGVYVSRDDLTNNGYSASMKNETNLDDLLFTYGIRIQPVLLQDAQSSSIVVSNGKDSQPVTMPWYYSPLLLPSHDDIITKNISNVKAEFVSQLDILSEQKTDTKNRVLLTTSDHTHIVQVPEPINFDVSGIQSSPHYFNKSYIPVSASLEGTFRSAFENRAIPDSIIAPDRYKTILRGKNARMVIATSSDIIRNGFVGQGENSQIIPMGFDYISGRQYGNKDFIVNAVNWLADGDQIMMLRNKTRELNLLNKQLISEKRNQYALLNTLAPILFVIVVTGLIYLHRRRKYEK